MNAPSCSTPLAWEDLLAYWLGELDADREAGIEQHYLGCEACSHRLAQLAALTQGVRAAVAASAVTAVLEDRFVQRLRDGGLRVREYRVPRNGFVNCTVTPEDDVVVGRLETPLDDVLRLDLEYLYGPDLPAERITDVPFVAERSAVVIATRIEDLRALPKSTLRIRVLAVESNSERVLGEYTFNHTPYRQR